MYLSFTRRTYIRFSDRAFIVLSGPDGGCLDQCGISPHCLRDIISETFPTRERPHSHSFNDKFLIPDIQQTPFLLLFLDHLSTFTASAEP
jgi:hypothetical protein